MKQDRFKNTPAKHQSCKQTQKKLLCHYKGKRTSVCRTEPEVLYIHSCHNP